MSNHQATQKLNTLKSFQLMSWAQKPDVFPRLSADRDEDLAAAAGEALGFPVTNSNIKGVRTALGVSKKRQPVGSVDSAQLLADLQELSGFVVGIAQQLGMAIPARVTTILER